MLRFVQRGVVRLVFFVVLAVDTFQVKIFYPASVHFLSPKTFLARRDPVSFKKEYNAVLTLSHEINNVSMMLLGYSELYQYQAPRLVSLIYDMKNSLRLFKESWVKAISDVPKGGATQENFINLRRVLDELRMATLRIYHQFKNLLKEEKLSAEEKEFAQFEREFVAKINFLINVFLGNQEMELEKMSLFEYLQNKKIMPSSSIKSNTDFYFDVASIEGHLVRSNKHALDHAYDNLIRNAQKHGQATQIGVKAFVQESRLTIEIKNDVGVEGHFIEPKWLQPVLVSSPESELPVKEQRLFVERFTTSAEDQDCHGFGLKACLDAVKMMGGTLKARSSVAETVFSIILPVAGSKLPRTSTGSLKIPESHKKRYCVSIEAAL